MEVAVHEAERSLFPGLTAPVTVTGGGGSVAAGIITGDFMLRLPLDDYWPSVHLAPYLFAGFGGIFVGGAGTAPRSVESLYVTNNAPGQTRAVTVTGRGVNRIRNNFGSDRVLGHVGGGLEYRFTPNIGIFGEVGYDFPNGSIEQLCPDQFRPQIRLLRKIKGQTITAVGTISWRATCRVNQLYRFAAPAIGHRSDSPDRQVRL